MERGLPFAAKLQTPLRVGQQESGPKLHRSPVGVLVGGPIRSTAGAWRRLWCMEMPVCGMQAFRDLDVCWLVTSSQGQVPGGEQNRRGQVG
ncbi:unnamed protein product [Staurois parvus]|uniref:Uncharacterized protein n=1 Tax=Staurois parvus TaxID=386267 RepID=A0ABN9E577_9NEOB|nr:unnamed protein product [Staurois parvus]